MFFDNANTQLQIRKSCDGAPRRNIFVAIVRCALAPPIITRDFRFRVSIMHVDVIKSPGFKTTSYALRLSASERVFLLA